MNSVTRKPPFGVGRFSKSMYGVCSVTATSLPGCVLGPSSAQLDADDQDWLTDFNSGTMWRRDLSASDSDVRAPVPRIASRRRHAHLAARASRRSGKQAEQSHRV